MFFIIASLELIGKKWNNFENKIFLLMISGIDSIEARDTEEEQKQDAVSSFNR